MIKEQTLNLADLVSSKRALKLFKSINSKIILEILLIEEKRFKKLLCF